MLTTAFAILLGFCFIAAGWYMFEHLWDRIQFRQRAGKDFTCNLPAAKVASLLREHPEVLPIDVRPAASYTADHLPGALNAPFVGTSLDATSLAGIPRDRPILVYCDGGYRSRRALPSLREAGFGSIYHLHRGLMSWKMAKQATESGPAT